MKDFSMRFVFDRKNETGFRDKEKIKGKKYKESGLLQIEVRQDGSDKRAWVSTDIRIRPDQFSDKMGFTCKNDDNAKSITGKARERYNKVYAFVESDKCINISYVKYWDKEDISTLSIAEFIKKEMKRNDPSYAVVEYHNSFLKRLEEFGKIRVFSDLTYENIVEFDTHLRKTISSEPTLHKRHSLFKRYIQEAINMGIYKGLNPYSIFKSRKGKSKDPVFLTEEELKRIQNYSPNYGYLERTRDLFLFQCFTGLAYIDLMTFTKDFIFEYNGRKVIQSNRTKTDESFIIPLLPEALKIAEKYNYQLPKLTNQKYNAYLKEIAKDDNVKINKPLSSHSARHTFATYLLNKDIPIETVSRILGHSNIRQTQHYAKLLAKKVIDDTNKLFEENTDKK